MFARTNTPTPSDGLPPTAGPSDLALCRSVLYSAIALGFRPPTADTIERVTSSEAAGALADAAAVLDEHAAASLPPASEGPRIRSCASALAGAEVGAEVLAAQHRRLFGHTARGEVPAYETEYGEEALFQQPQELSDLAGFMRAFGLVPRAEVRERIDHISCECEFAAFLACKEAYAIDREDSEMRAVTEQATQLFLRDHLARFAPAFVGRLRRQEGGLYPTLGELLLALVRYECQRLSISAGPEGLNLRPDPAAFAAPMGCAESGSACSGLQRTP